VGRNKTYIVLAVKLKLIKFLDIFGKVYQESVTIHPTHFKPTDEYLKMMDRESKLNNLGI
jgi:hypothetical protein